MKPIKWWLSSVRAQVIGTLCLAFVSTCLVYICMRNGYLPIFIFPIELGVIGLFAVLGTIVFLFRNPEQKRILKYFARMPWMNILYAQVCIFFVLSTSSYILTQAVAKDDSFGTIVRAYSVSTGIIVLTVFCIESIALMRQLRVRGK